MKNTKKNKKKWVEKVKDTLILGGRSERTFDNYKSHITRFLDYYDENIDINKLSDDDIVAYFKKQYINFNRCAETLNVGICSVRYLYSVCLNRKINKDILPSTKVIKRMPTIISKELFLKIFNEESCIKHKCWLILAFCSGLRVEEIATLRIENIFPSEHKLKILGKRNKERYTILPDIVTKFLRLYYKEQHITEKSGYLFNGINDNEHMNNKSIINYFSTLKVAYNLNINLTFHCLRHSFATYYLMNGGNIITLKSMLGHSHLDTTNRYLHIAQNFNNLEGIMSKFTIQDIFIKYGDEYIRRFLLHVLPDNFTKIKHYGILSNRNKKNNIRFCRFLISKIITNEFVSTTSRIFNKFKCDKCGSTNFTYSFNYNFERLGLN